MSQFWVGNLFLMLSMLTGAAGQVALKYVMNRTGTLSFDGRAVSSVFSTGSAPIAALAIVLLASGVFFWLASLNRLDLSYAYPVACASAILVVIFGVIFLDEAISFRSCIAIMLIVLGTALLTLSQ